MKRLIPAGLCVLLSVICLAAKVKAQHFLSIQSGDKQPFAIQVNGNNFSSSKTGSLRIANLSAGNYSLAITPGGKKYPPQNFTCVIEKSDLSYTLVNDGKNGWLLKNTKSPEVIVSSTPVKEPEEVVKNEQKNEPSATSPFAIMLAQVINDPDLLKPTPWVLSTKVGLDESQDMSAAMNEAEQQDTSTYVAATKGVIKASEAPVKGGTEIVFVDFNAELGDTIHIVIPSTGEDSTAVEQTQQQQATPDSRPAEKKDSVAQQQPPSPVVNNNTKADSTSATVKKEETAIPFDTSSNRQFTNPFFKKDDSSPVAATTSANVAASPVDDHSAGVQKDTTADVIEKKSTTVQPAADASKPMVKSDCKKMLSDNDEEKLKHKIYLETDQDKILALTRKALDGRCISTAQVKELASFFLSDDARYNFFFTVYPYVYDFGNFSSLEPYMIDRKYKNMFEAMIK